jgi:two-component sensor histidine kinase
MALHELATNVVKYGSLSNGTGQVRVEWERIRDSESDRVIFHSREVGGAACHSGGPHEFGRLLIERALEAELGSARI